MAKHKFPSSEALVYIPSDTWEEYDTARKEAIKASTFIKTLSPFEKMLQAGGHIILQKCINATNAKIGNNIEYCVKTDNVKDCREELDWDCYESLMDEIYKICRDKILVEKNSTNESDDKIKKIALWSRTCEGVIKDKKTTEIRDSSGSKIVFEKSENKEGITYHIKVYTSGASII